METTADLILNAVFRILEAVSPDYSEPDYVDAQGIYIDPTSTADLGCALTPDGMWADDTHHVGL